MEQKESNFELFARQYEAWKLLHDNIHTEIVYGGGAGGGKSVLLSLWIASGIIAMPGSTWCIGRSELKKIKLSTLQTFFKVLQTLGFKEKKGYKYNEQLGTITFSNKSKVFLMDLNHNPSDPEFDRLGSIEFTGAAVDEAQEIENKARQVLNSRIRNLVGQELFRGNSKKEAEEWINKNKKGVYYYNEAMDKHLVVLRLQNKPKLFMTCNPGRNFIYTDFYKPFTNDSIEEHRAFVRSLPTDNPFLSPEYIENMKRGDHTTVQRLVYGNFDYVDDPGLLFNIDEVSEIFNFKVKTTGQYYLCIDAARAGKDKTTIGLFNGLHLEKIKEIPQGNLVAQKKVIQEEFINEYNIPLSRIIVDEVGVGGGLVDMLGCRGFIANAAPLNPYATKLKEYTYLKRNYTNLKTQAFFCLQRYIREKKISVNCNKDQKEQLIEELLFIKQINLDNDSKIQLESKKDLKEKLGRSPDLADMLSFRMRWILKDYHEGEIPEEDKTKEDEKQDLLSWLMEEEEKEPIGVDFDVY